MPMYSITEHDHVRELLEVPCPSSATPEPIVLANEDTLIVAYGSAAAPTAPAGDLQAAPAPTAQTTVVVFRECFASHFGLPNDEAFAFHPLADRGLRPYGAFEVERSSWLRGLAMRNRAHPHHDPAQFERLRHWVWTFQHAVLECAALDFQVVDVPGRPGEAIPHMQALLGLRASL
jgi:hypothetical protein